MPSIIWVSNSIGWFASVWAAASDGSIHHVVRSTHESNHDRCSDPPPSRPCTHERGSSGELIVERYAALRRRVLLDRESGRGPGLKAAVEIRCPLEAERLQCR